MRRRLSDRHRSAPIAASFVAVAAVALPATARGEIVTDRPDTAESSETVGQFRLQVELGGGFETEKIGGQRVTSVRMPTKIRFGLLDRWELHVESGWLAYDHASGGGGSGSDTGLDDVDLGTKVHFLESAGVVPSMGALLALTLPVGSDGKSGEAFLLKPTVAADWTLPAHWGVGVNLGATFALSERDTNADTLRYAVSVGRTWAPLTDRLRTFVEILGETAFDGGTTALAFDGGFTLLVLPRLQLDLSVLVGITETAPDVGAGTGLAFKI